MKSNTYTLENTDADISSSEAAPRWIDRLAKRLLLQKLAEIKHGRLTLIDGTQREVFGQTSPQCDLDITLRVHDAQAYSDVAFGGTVGSGEAYMAGNWECDDLTGLVRGVNRKATPAGADLNDVIFRGELELVTDAL